MKLNYFRLPIKNVLSRSKYYSMFFLCFVIFVGSALMFYFYNPNYTRASGGNLNWQAIASSSDGTKLIAGRWCGSIFTSGDSGVTWTAQTTSGYQCWRSVASNAMGTKLYAVTDGKIFSSTDSGITWGMKKTSVQGYWASIATNGLGDKVVAVENGGDIWTSNDSGNTWIDRTNSLGFKNWNSVASNALGDKLVAVDLGNGYIYTSTNYGVSWTTNSNSSGQGYWYSVASDSTGLKLVAAYENSGYIYTSIDGGITWTTNSNSSGQKNWFSVSSSSDGIKLIAGAVNEYVYVSTDSGVTWTSNDNSSGPGYWGTVTSDSTGGHLAAANNSGEIVTSVDNGVTWNTNNSGVTGYVHVTTVDQNNTPVSGVSVQVECEGGVWTDLGTTDVDGTANGIPGVDALCTDSTRIILKYSKSGYLDSQTYFNNNDYYYTTDNFNFIVNIPSVESGHTDSYLAEYWNVPGGSQTQPRFPTTAPDFTATAQTIDSDWLSGSPNSAINIDGFLARYSKTTHFDAGDYRFTIDSDDGNKVYIDGVLVNDDWNNRGSGSPDIQTKTISAGDHTITVEYYENGGNATLHFSYVPVSIISNAVEVYESADTAVTPNTPGNISTLDNTVAHDGTYLTTSISTNDSGYDSQVFKFSSDFTGIDLPKFSTNWFGHGAVPSNKNVTLSIWNFLSNTWDQIISDHCAVDCALSGFKTGTGYKDDSGNSWIWAKADNSYGPPVISNETDSGGLLPVQWNTSVAATTQIAYDTVSHANWGDYANHLTDSTMVTSHIMSPALTSNTTEYWRSLASSSDGLKAAGATDCGYIWTTTDGGTTWNQSGSSNSCWTSIAMSADGSVIAASASGDSIYISTDGGATWTTDSISSGARSWNSIAISADGTHIAAVDNNYGYIYTSTDTGVTWTTNSDSSGQNYWQSISSDGTGLKLVAVVSNNNYVYTSTNGGVTWSTNNNSSGNHYWYAVASSSDGTKLAAADENYGYIYLSNDGGLTWTPNTAAGMNYWFTISMSGDGSKIVAGISCGNIYTSNDGGATWINHTNLSGCWNATSISSDGQHMYAAKNGGSIFSSTDGGVSWVNQTGQFWYYRIRSTNATGSVITSDEYSMHFDGSSSCPFIFTNDGNKYNFIIDASSSASLGSGLDIPLWTANQFYKDGAYPNPLSYVKIPNGYLAPVGTTGHSYYDIKTTFELNEVNYLDQVALQVVDHDPSVDIYPDYRNTGVIHTISKTAPAPVSVTTQDGRDVTSLIASNDNVFWHSTKGMNPNYITIKLTDDANTPANLKLVIKKSKEGEFTGSKGTDQFQYKNSSGVFVPLPLAYNPFSSTRDGALKSSRNVVNTFGTDTKVIDLSGLSIKDNTIRLITANNQLQWDIDWMAVDTSPDASLTTTTLEPSYADLHFRGVSKKVFTNPSDPNMTSLRQPDYSQLVKNIGQGQPLTGNATRYGDVLPLITSVDNKFVIPVQGDELSLKYSVPEQVGGTTRDFIYKTWDYHKSWHIPTGTTITPLPFNEMTRFPYKTSEENYPLDADHFAYQNTYNTRVINWGTAQDTQIHHSLNTDVLSLSISEGTDITPPSTPTASPIANTYNSAQSVTLSSVGSDSIRYSTSSIPADCSSGILYFGAISVSTSETIYVRACKSSNSTSSVANFPFIISASHGGGYQIIPNYLNKIILPQSQTSTPTVSINTPAKITNIGLPLGFQFKKDLKPMTTKSDIKNLQIFLNNNGFLISKTGAGSKGKENNYFGLKTKQALIKFQEAYAKDILTPQGFKKGTGILGPYTRKIINVWLLNTNH